MTRIQEQKTATEAAQELWTLVLPDVEPPGAHQFFLWTDRFLPEVVTRGIVRAAAKYKKMSRTLTPMTSEDAHRYASSVMKHEAALHYQSEDSTI